RAVRGMVPYPTRARVSRTQLAVWVIGGLGFLRRFMHLALPGALRAMRRNQHPLAQERVITAMRCVSQIHRHGWLLPCVVQHFAMPTPSAAEHTYISGRRPVFSS